MPPQSVFFPALGLAKKLSAPIPFAQPSRTNPSFQIPSLEQYKADCQRSVEDPVGFRTGVAAAFQRRKKWNKVLERNFRRPNVKRFIGGKLAAVWAPNEPNGRVRLVIYNRLHKRVCRAGQTLCNTIHGHCNSRYLYSVEQTLKHHPCTAIGSGRGSMNKARQKCLTSTIHKIKLLFGLMLTKFPTCSTAGTLAILIARLIIYIKPKINSLS